MQTPLCEVVGCHRAAAWVRIKNINCRHEDFLCQNCWHGLRCRKPTEACCYVPADLADASISEYDKGSLPDFQDESVIQIN